MTRSIIYKLIMQASYKEIREELTTVKEWWASTHFINHVFLHNHPKRSTEVCKFTLIGINTEKDNFKIIILKALGSNQEF